MTNCSDNSDKQQTESNYVSNGANTGMPSGIKKALKTHAVNSQSCSNPPVMDTWDRQESQNHHNTQS